MIMVVFIKDVGGVVKEKRTEWVKTRGINKTESWRSEVVFQNEMFAQLNLKLKIITTLNFRSFIRDQLYHLPSTIFTIYGYITNSQQDQLSIGLKAQLVKHLVYQRSRVQIPLRHYFHSCLSCVYNSDDHSCLMVLLAFFLSFEHLLLQIWWLCLLPENNDKNERCRRHNQKQTPTSYKKCLHCKN